MFVAIKFQSKEYFSVIIWISVCVLYRISINILMNNISYRHLIINSKFLKIIKKYIFLIIRYLYKIFIFNNIYVKCVIIFKSHIFVTYRLTTSVIDQIFEISRYFRRKWFLFVALDIVFLTECWWTCLHIVFWCLL